MFHFRLENECRAKGIVPKEALLEIFSNITAINQFHRDFLLPKLDERMENWLVYFIMFVIVASNIFMFLNLSLLSFFSTFIGRKTLVLEIFLTISPHF